MRVRIFISFLLVGMLLLLSCGSEPAEKVLTQEEIVKATVEAKLAEDALQATVLAEYSVALTATALPNEPRASETPSPLTLSLTPLPTQIPATPTPTQVPKPSFESHMRTGLDLKDEGKFLAAIEEFTLALEINPDSAEAFFQRGLTYDSFEYPTDRVITSEELEALSHQTKSALADLTQAILLDPSNAEYWFQRSRKLPYDADPELILADLTEAINLDPMVPGYYASRAWEYKSLAWLDRPLSSTGPSTDADICQLAVDDISRAIHLDPTNVDFLYKRVDAYDCLLWSYSSLDRDWNPVEEIHKLVRKQIRDLTSAINLEPNNPESYTRRAGYYTSSLDLYSLVPHDHVCKKRQCIPEWEIAAPLAVADYTKAINLEPSNPDYYIYRAEQYYRMFYDGFMGDFAWLATVDYKKARELGGENSFNKDYEIRAALAAEDCAHAWSVIQENGLSEKYNRDDLFIGRYHACLGDWSMALREYEKLSWEKGSYKSIYPAEAYFYLERYVEAQEELEAFIEYAEDGPMRNKYSEAERSAAQGNTRYYPELTKALTLSLITNTRLKTLSASVYQDRMSKLKKLGFEDIYLLDEVTEYIDIAFHR